VNGTGSGLREKVVFDISHVHSFVSVIRQFLVALNLKFLSPLFKMFFCQWVGQAYRFCGTGKYMAPETILCRGYSFVGILYLDNVKITISLF
jgi:hypothetical protein